MWAAALGWPAAVVRVVVSTLRCALPKVPVVYVAIVESIDHVHVQPILDKAERAMACHRGDLGAQHRGSRRVRHRAAVSGG
jgi:hypothetical protein